MKIKAFLAGAMVANSTPHLATAVTGRVMLTPLAGYDSSARVNAVWGLANLAGGLMLVRRVAGTTSTGHRGTTARPARWDERMHWFELGATVFTVWMLASERVLGLNSTDR